MSKIVEKIKTRGYWRIRIIPYPFAVERIGSLARLEEIIRSTQVRLRGWYFPHINERGGISRALDYISNETDWSSYLEYWQFHQSGQLIDFVGMYEDWQDQSEFQSARESWSPGKALGLFEVVYRFTEIFELANRLATTEAVEERTRIEVLACGLKGRNLVMDDPSRSPVFTHGPSEIDELPYSIDLETSDLVANPRESAIEPARRMYERLGLDATPEAIRSWQSELGR